VSKKDLKKKLNIGFSEITPDIDVNAVSFKTSDTLSDTEKEEIFGVKEKRGADHFKVYAFAVSFAIIMIVSLGFILRANGLSRVLIQVNPSVELRVKDGNVVKIKAENQDAVEIVEAIETGQSLDDTVNAVIRKIAEKHYFENNDNIYITVSGKNEAEIEKQVEKQAKKTLNEMDLKVSVVLGEKPDKEEHPGNKAVEQKEEGGSAESVPAPETTVKPVRTTEAATQAVAEETTEIKKESEAAITASVSESTEEAAAGRSSADDQKSDSASGNEEKATEASDHGKSADEKKEKEKKEEEKKEKEKKEKEKKEKEKKEKAEKEKKEKEKREKEEKTKKEKTIENNGNKNKEKSTGKEKDK